MHRLSQAAVLSAAFFGFASAACAAPSVIRIDNPKALPESIAMAPDGSLIMGSSGLPAIFRAAPGAAVAQPWIDASADGKASFLGMMVDAPAGTLWSCEITMNPGEPRRSQLRAFDLATGASKLRWPLPGDTSNCNDFAVMPDHTVYFSDTFNSRIYKIAPGSQTPVLWLEDRSLYGIDGITQMDGVIYVNTVFSNNVLRVPMDATGKAMTPVDIWMDQPLLGPDGLRAAHGKLFVAENRGSKVDSIVINGDKGHVVTVKDGLGAPTAVEPVGDTLWIGDRTNNQAIAVPMPQ